MGLWIVISAGPSLCTVSSFWAVTTSADLKTWQQLLLSGWQAVQAHNHSLNQVTKILQGFDWKKVSFIKRKILIHYSHVVRQPLFITFFTQIQCKQNLFLWFNPEYRGTDFKSIQWVTKPEGIPVMTALLQDVIQICWRVHFWGFTSIYGSFRVHNTLHSQIRIVKKIKSRQKCKKHHFYPRLCVLFTCLLYQALASILINRVGNEDSPSTTNISSQIAWEEGCGSLISQYKTYASWHSVLPTIIPFLVCLVTWGNPIINHRNSRTVALWDSYPLSHSIVYYYYYSQWTVTQEEYTELVEEEEVW